MKRKKNLQNVMNRMGALLMAGAIAVTGFTIPVNAAETTGMVQAVTEEKLEIPIVREGEGTLITDTVVANEHGNDYIVDHVFFISDEIKDAVAGNTPIGLEVNVSVSSFTCTNTAVAPTIVLYAMDEGYVDWQQNAVTLTETGKVYNCTLSLSGYETLGLLGIRFVGCDEGSEISYTIESAKIAEEAQAEIDENAVANLVDSVTTQTATVVKNAYGDDYIVDKTFTIPHDLTFGLEGFTSLSLVVNATVSNYTPDETLVDKPDTDDREDIPLALIYAQDSKYAIWKQTGESLTEDSQTVELTLDLAPFIEDGTLGALGFRISGCREGSTLNYTINYAKLVGEGESLAGSNLIELKYELSGEKKELAFEQTEVGQHGALSMADVKGYTAPVIVDKNGVPYQLRGASSHGLSWFPQYVNKNAYHTLRDDWGMNMVRIAVYGREGTYAYTNGYASVSDEEAKAYNDEIIQRGVQAATELGMYVILDWHVLRYNPNEDIEEAKAFFEKYATMYKDYDNVLFEICNEPLDTKWYDGTDNDLYTYCTQVTKVIRDCGSDAIVICGTNNYSAEVDEVAGHLLEDKNTIYTCHFYAASHYEEPQKRLTDALANGVPVFISEFGICTASGDGVSDFENADVWLDICDANNVSYACWAMSNSPESAAYFQTECSKSDGAWKEDELTNTSIYLINRYLARKEMLEKEPENEVTCAHTKTVVKNAKQATEKEEGYTGDTYCADCGKKIADGKQIAKTAGNTKTESPDIIPEEKGVVKGDIYEDAKSGLRYKVLTVGKKTKTVECIGTKNKKRQSVTIPATVKISGSSFKVVSIANKAFANHKKLTGLVIGSNVKKIGTKAFYGCKKLKKITIKSTKLQSKKIGNKAFSNTNKKMELKVPKKKQKAYKKMLVKKGISAKAVMK